MKNVIWFLRIIVGSVLFSLGFNLFLAPNDLNAGGISGLAQILAQVLGFGSVGVITALLNLPLFALGGMKIGKRFFWGSLAGMLALTVALEALSFLPQLQTEPLIAALYGGVLGGIGLGMVFAAGASTGGSDIIVRLLKMKMQHVPIGTINICFDLAVAVLTGIAFGDMTRALYSGVAIFVTGQVIDAVVYRFDYSKAVMIISEHHEAIAKIIMEDLDRGATYLNGEGTYSHKERKVIFTVVKKQQIAELKRLVVQIDPDAFIVVQEAHQVLGEGFSRYSKDSL
jgi:uncharacterized membrane-anchored protein YitT (DUF2179 family)